MRPLPARAEYPRMIYTRPGETPTSQRHAVHNNSVLCSSPIPAAQIGSHAPTLQPVQLALLVRARDSRMGPGPRQCGCSHTGAELGASSGGSARTDPGWLCSPVSAKRTRVRCWISADVHTRSAVNIIRCRDGACDRNRAKLTRISARGWCCVRGAGAVPLCSRGCCRLRTFRRLWDH